MNKIQQIRDLINGEQQPFFEVGMKITAARLPGGFIQICKFDDNEDVNQRIVSKKEWKQIRKEYKPQGLFENVSDYIPGNYLDIVTQGLDQG